MHAYVLSPLFLQYLHKFLVIALSLPLPLSLSAVQQKFDVTKMHTKGSRESQHLVDDGSGKVEVENNIM